MAKKEITRVPVKILALKEDRSDGRLVVYFQSDESIRKRKIADRIRELKILISDVLVTNRFLEGYPEYYPDSKFEGELNVSDKDYNKIVEKTQQDYLRSLEEIRTEFEREKRCLEQAELKFHAGILKPDDPEFVEWL